MRKAISALQNDAVIVAVRIPRISATHAPGRLPPNPYEACPSRHGKVATQSTATLPSPPRDACHRRSTATPSRYMLTLL